MKAHGPAINRLNVYPVPDGDTGTNMSRTLDAVVAELDTAEQDMGPTCAAISHGSLMGARGNSGVILSQVLRGLSSALKDAPTATPTQVAEALRQWAEGEPLQSDEPQPGGVVSGAEREAAAGTPGSVRVYLRTL